MTKKLTYVEIDVPVFYTSSEVLLHCDGDFLFDSNTLGGRHDWTLEGNAAFFHGAGQYQFGGGALFADGNGDYAWMDGNTDDVALGAGDFTIDFWFACYKVSGLLARMAGQTNLAYTDYAWGIFRFTDNKIHFQFTSNGNSAALNLVSTSTFIDDTIWHHLAVVRSGNTFTLYIDGIAEASNTSSAAVWRSSSTFSIHTIGGDTTAADMWRGFIDEFRLTKGLARWTTNFNTASLEDPSQLTTLRFAVDTGYLPNDIDCIPSIESVKITPAIISLGENLGQRASVSVVFKDHRHHFAGSDGDYDTGTFWGKFRARYGATIREYPLRVINGDLGQAIENMETRHFVIDSSNGPLAQGKHELIAKDGLKLADGDRAQIPLLSEGFLSGPITNSDTTLTLSPAGIGSTYPSSAFANLGGKEIVQYTRSGDVLTITRAAFNTVAVAHVAQERVQLCVHFEDFSVADIMDFLFASYTSTPGFWRPVANWEAESDAYLGTVYTALIAEPTSVSQLLSEIIEQAGLAIWWDDITQKINMQVLRPVPSNAFTFTADNYLVDSLQVEDQPEKRLSQIYVYFCKLNPLINDDQINNYAFSSSIVDTASELLYGTAVIKKIYSRWIPNDGRTVADNLNLVLLSRFRDPPRRFKFDILRDSGVTPLLGVGYMIEGWPLQTPVGDAESVPIQITQINPRADIFEVEAEEIIFSNIPVSAIGVDPGLVHSIVIGTSANNINLRSMHDSTFGTPVSGQTIHFTIQSGVIIGSSSVSQAACETGFWPGGVTVTLTVLGRIQGAGGKGGIGRSLGFAAGTGTSGQNGGDALSVSNALSLTDASGQIWGGGGGGGGASATGFLRNSCGGGGAGTVAGVHGDGDTNTTHSADGNSESGGAAAGVSSGMNGGAGGNPGQNGGTGFGSISGGTAGHSIVGIGNVTTVGSPGDRQGPTA